MAEALRGAAGIAESATEQEVIDALLALTQPDDPDRERIATRAAAILGAGEAGTTEEIFWALRRLVENAAYAEPVVLVLDDVHWAEPVLLDLVEHMTEWIRDRPVLLVVTGRPELRELRPSFVEGGRASAVIALEGLDEGETARLAFGLLGTDDVPDELLAKIPASTQGNPLFVRELVRMLVDDGVLRRDGDRWSVTVDVDAIEVPPTIQSLYTCRPPPTGRAGRRRACLCRRQRVLPRCPPRARATGRA
jgi:predicted ATPase